MSTTAIATMIVILAFVWGGFLFLIIAAVRKERRKRDGAAADRERAGTAPGTGDGSPILLVTGLLAIGLAAGPATACFRPPPPETVPGSATGEAERPSAAASSPAARQEAAAPPAPSLTEAQRIEVERLRELGPIYTPYEQGPRPLENPEAERALVEKLAPVLEAHDLPIGTRTLVWVLIGADGAVHDARVQTGSSNDAFDREAMEVAKRLRFAPATTGGRPVAVWVIREISLLMP